jgi:hypothetical protein
MASVLTGLFSNARIKPAESLSSLKGSRVLSRFITFGITNSANSKVVKRSAHSMHWRLRLICSPPDTKRESMTLVSCARQNGQNMRPTPIK